MIKLKTDCEKCIHSRVCKKKNKPECVRENIEDMMSKRIVLDEFDMVNIDISCPDFSSNYCQTIRMV